MPDPVTIIKALTFDVFGTLLDYEGCPWIEAYAAEVQAVAKGRKPYRRLDAIFAEIGADWRDLRPRPGVVEALGRLKDRFTVAPLSNANADLSRDMAMYFGFPWTLVIDTEAAVAFKPDPKVYRLGLDRLGLEAPEVLHVAAHDFDLIAAEAMGFKTAYLEWPGYTRPSVVAFDYRAPGLLELAGMLGAPGA
jgi:2-haloacid dehalogenase